MYWAHCGEDQGRTPSPLADHGPTRRKADTTGRRTPSAPDWEHHRTPAPPYCPAGRSTHQRPTGGAPLAGAHSDTTTTATGGRSQWRPGLRPWHPGPMRPRHHGGGVGAGPEHAPLRPGNPPPRPLGAPPQAEPAPRQRTRMNTTATVAPPQAHPPAAGRCQQPNKRPRKPLRPLTTGRSRAKSPRATATSPLTDRKRISSMRARRTSAEQRATGAPTESQ